MMIRTPRLVLRQWRPSDLPAYAALNSDPEVRRFWPSTLTREQSDAEASRFRKHIEEHGFGFWAVGLLGVAPFIGFTGLKHVALPFPFAPAIEAGWRLARPYWGYGYATEAAVAALAYGFGPVNLPEIVAYAVAGNIASHRVMDRIGMRRDTQGDFDLPATEGSLLRQGVLFRVAKDEFIASRIAEAAGVIFIETNGEGPGVRLSKGRA